MNPWIPIAISIVTAVIMALVGFIVKRELGRIATDIAEIKKVRAEILSELKDRLVTCDAKFLSRELFNTLDAARKEVDQLRRDADGRLEGLIKDLLSKYGG